MSFENFKSTLMLAKMILLARKNLVGSEFCNLGLGVGLTQKGKQVTINTEGDVSSANTDEANPMTYSDVDTTASTLTITLDKTISVKLHDRDMHEIECGRQSLEGALASRMMYVLNGDVDVLVMEQYANAGSDSFETGSTPWQWGSDASDWPKFCAAVHKGLDDVDAPAEGRFLTLPNVAIQAIRLYYGSRATNLGDQMHQNGLVAKDLFGFSVYGSRNVQGSSTLHGLAGVKGDGLALAVQISPTIEKIRLEGFWADGIRARVTAGAKVYKPANVIDINLNATLLA